jgi:SAM-dependent methyltransferase
MAIRRKDFDATLDRFDATDDFTRKYYRRAKNRGWATFQYLPSGNGVKTLIDVGGMNGLFAPAYLDIWKYREVSVVGNDAPPGGSVSVPTADGLCPIPAKSCDIETEQWPYADESFDMAVCTEVLEHMLFDPMFVMTEMNRVLKPGGMALITVPNTTSDTCLIWLINGMQPGYLRFYNTRALDTGRRDFGIVGHMGHFHEYTRVDLECLVGAANFNIECLTGISFEPPLMDSMKFRLFKWLARAMFPRSKRIREDVLLCLIQKKHYTPLDKLKIRYPAPLYREI